MTPTRLVDECNEAIAADRDLQLVVKRKNPPTGNVRLAGRYGPVSVDIACATQLEDGDWQIVAWWDPKAVLRWVSKAFGE